MSEKSISPTQSTNQTATTSPPLKTERPRFQSKASEKGLELSILLPGVRKESLSVDIEDRLLTVTGIRESASYSGYGEQADEARKYQLRVNIHDDLDTSNIIASHLDGMLTLTLTKRPEISKRSIDILAN